jgi:hypothetical protein
MSVSKLRLPFLTPAKRQTEHGLCPKLERTLERFDQRAGVEGGSGGRQLCLFFLAHHESGQIVGEFQRPERLSKKPAGSKYDVTSVEYDAQVQ